MVTPRLVRIARAMVASVCALGLALAWLVAPSAGLAHSSPAASAPPPARALAKRPTADPRAPVRSRAAGAPFLTQAHAVARGRYALACAQLSKVVLRKAHVRSLGAARRVCATQLRSAAKHLDRGRLRSLASTRVVEARVEHGRARVTVQTTLYGLEPRATGIAVREDGRWKIARLPSGAHVGRSLVERIPSSSMIPTLRVGDTILVDQDAYRKGRPAIGDIVVFHPPVGADGVGHCAIRPPAGQACAAADRRDSEALFVKRIVAGPGDRISIRDGHVIRNGTLAAEDFITPCGPEGEGCDFPRTFTVRAGRYYLLGDNRGASADSRFWGPIPAPSILGPVQRIGP